MKGIVLGPQEQIAADQFRSFYAGLLSIRDAIRTPPAGGEAAPDDLPTAGAPTIDEVRVQLARAIADFGYQQGDIHTPVEVDTGYVMAAVADEVLLVQCAAWVERDAWAERPLEAILYGSRLAGERIFVAADDLVGARRADARAATAILLALLTGFKGRFHGHKDGGRIGALEKGLYQLVCKRPYAPDDTLPYAMPEPVATTLAGASMRRLPALWPWLVALLMVALAYLPVSHLLWWSRVRPVDVLAHSIIANAPAESVPPTP